MASRQLDDKVERAEARRLYHYLSGKLAKKTQSPKVIRYTIEDMVAGHQRFLTEEFLKAQSPKRRRSLLRLVRDSDKPKNSAG